MNQREVREDTHKKSVYFLVVVPLRFNPPYTNGLVVHATFFFFFFLVFYGFWQFFLFLPNFWAKTARFKKKKCFLWVVRGVYPPYTLSGHTTETKHFFYVCHPLLLLIYIDVWFCQDKRRKKHYKPLPSFISSESLHKLLLN